MSDSVIKFRAIGRQDGNHDDYYFTTPKLPCLVDLNEVVIFMRPWEKDGRFGLDVEIKPYTKGKGQQKGKRHPSAA